MYPVIKPDGSKVTPPLHTGRGRPALYPWKYLEVGDHFVASGDDLKSIRVMMSNGRVFGRGQILGCVHLGFPFERGLAGNPVPSPAGSVPSGHSQRSPS